MTSFARQLRRRRLHHYSDRLFVVPLDHAVSDGPIVADGDLDALIGQLTDHGVDAVVLHKGWLRQIRPARLRAMSLLVHLSASTALAPDPDYRYRQSERRRRQEHYLGYAGGRARHQEL